MWTSDANNNLEGQITLIIFASVLAWSTVQEMLDTGSSTRLLSQFMISNKHMRLYENAVLPTGRIKSRWRDVLHGVQSETLALNFSLLPLSFAWHCQEVLAPATPILCVGHVLLVFWLHTVCIAYEILFL